MHYLLNDSSVYILHKLLPILCKAGGQRGTNSRKQLIEQCNQCQKLHEPVLYMTDLQLPVQSTAAKYRQQKLDANPQCAAVPLVAQDVISAPASQAFVD